MLSCRARLLLRWWRLLLRLLRRWNSANGSGHLSGHRIRLPRNRWRPGRWYSRSGCSGAGTTYGWLMLLRRLWRIGTLLRWRRIRGTAVPSVGIGRRRWSPSGPTRRRWWSASVRRSFSCFRWSVRWIERSIRWRVLALLTGWWRILAGRCTSSWTVLVRGSILPVTTRLSWVRSARMR